VLIGFDGQPEGKRAIKEGKIYADPVQFPDRIGRETARAIVAATRYPPQGVRGAAFGVAHDDYRPGDVPTKVRRANAHTLVIAMIETAPGIEQVEAIAAVPGVDVLWLGHYDLTNSLGVPGDFAHPRFRAAVDRLIAAANAAGKPLGYMARSVAEARAMRARGFRMLAYSGDIWLLQDALAAALTELRSDRAGSRRPRSPSAPARRRPRRRSAPR